MSIQIASLASNLLSKLHARALHQRYLLGVTGIPAAGKSTFAELLVSAINEDASQNIAITLPMDGFHLRNEVLEAHGLRAMKGGPGTFDAQGFVELLKKLRDISSAPIYCPT
jgi:pantothenate kinase